MKVFALSLCLIFAGSAPLFSADSGPREVTFAEHIAPMIFQNCTSCHRPGQVAPFSLLNYTQAQKHAKTMLRVIKDRYMPPWHPEPGHGEFRDELRLTGEQIALFDRWVATGMKEGDPAKVPPLPKFPEGWRLGEPDLVVKMDRPYVVPANGPDIYQNFVIPLNLTEDKWVTAVEFRASEPVVVHHVLYMLDDLGRARARLKKEGQPGYEGVSLGFVPSGTLGGWAVGATPIRLPEGLAYPVRKGSDLVLNTHFHLSGKEVKEDLTVGLYFASKPPTRHLESLALPPVFGLFSNIKIPAGAANYKVTDSIVLPVDVDLVGVNGHAHQLGKTMKAAAILPDGTQKKLFSIPEWDFNWQGQYLYKQFVRLPKGTVIHAEVTWDNSASNPRNPHNPPVAMEWGESTNEEMGQVGFKLLAADEADNPRLKLAIHMHNEEAGRASWLRGDRIDWKKLKAAPPDYWKERAPFPKQAATDTRKTFRDLDGTLRQPFASDGVKASVLFFLTTECPNANSYIPEITAMAKEFADRPVRFYAVQVEPGLTVDAAREHVKKYSLTIPLIMDESHALVAAAGATRTPEVAVFLEDGSLAYLGRIDDRYAALGKKRPMPTRTDLRDALTDILAGNKVRVSRTEAIGCSIPDLTKSAK